MFLLVVNLVSISLHAYVGSRLASFFVPGSWAARSVWTGTWLLFATLIAGMFLSRAAIPAFPAKAVVVTGFVWMGVLFLLFTASLAGDALGGLARLASLVSGMDASGVVRCIRLALIALVPVAAFYGVWQALRPPAIHEVEVSVPGLAKEWDGARIAHLTDTHIGPILGRDWVEDLVRRVDSAKPDIVVHTGDLVDGSVGRLRSALEPLSRLRGREGTFFVTGNHEGYSGISSWCEQMRLWGWDVLTNESRILSRNGANLALVGITDAHEGAMHGGIAPDVARAVSGLADGAPRILLAHQPLQAFQAQGHGIALQLSGHTHGGQIWPFNFLVRLQQPMVAGFATIGDVRVFTSRGAGFWGPPLRLGAPAEVPILVLRSM
ncbi:MAG: hypothetical protein RL173_2686 [Fibrobacterota bacterium]